MTQRTKKKKTPTIQHSKLLHTQNNSTETDKNTLERTTKPTGRKRPPPADSESELEVVTTTRKTPMRAVRQKIEKAPTRKQTVTDKKEPPALETTQVPINTQNQKKKKKKKEKIVHNKKQPDVSDDRALQPMEISPEKGENAGRQSPIAKQKVVKKVIKKKAGNEVRLPVTVVEDANENIPEEPDTKQPVKRTRAKRKSIVNVELPLTPARKRTVPTVREPVEGNLPEQRTQKAAKSSAKQKTLQHSPELTNRAIPLRGNENDGEGSECTTSNAAVTKKTVKRKIHAEEAAKSSAKQKTLQHSPELTNRSAAVPLRGNGNDGEGSECTTNNAAVTKKAVKRKIHAEKAPKRQVLASKTQPSSVEDSAAEVNENDHDDGGATLKTVRRVKKNSRIQASDDSTGMEDNHRQRKQNIASQKKASSKKDTVNRIDAEETMGVNREAPHRSSLLLPVNESSSKQKTLQHSPEMTNRGAAVHLRGNGNGDEGSECTSNEGAVSKKAVKRKIHAEEVPKRQMLASKTQPSSVEDSAAEVNENDHVDDGATLKPIRRGKKISRIQASDDSTGIEDKHRQRNQNIARQKMASSKKDTVNQIDADETLGVNREAPPPSSLLLPTPPSPPHSYGKPFVFSGISTGDHHDTVIALPTSDTPMIQKNREFREGGGMNRRRSSFVMRGKRASSMSGGSLIALPHPGVPSETFFRHIAAEAPEPIRMKQLLAWCARRVEIPAGGVDPQALEIAQQVRERIINAILGGKISTSWYNRKEDDVLPEITGPKELKEHPQNVDNRRLLKEHEEAIERLEREDAAWTATLREYNSRHAAVVDSCPVLSDEPVVIDVDGEGEERRVIREAMDGALAAVEERLGDELMNVDDDWLESTMAEVEIKVDRLHSVLHTATQFSHVTREYTEDLFTKLLASLSARRRGDCPDGVRDSSNSDPIHVLRALAAASVAAADANSSTVQSSSTSSTSMVEGTSPS